MAYPSDPKGFATYCTGAKLKQCSTCEHAHNNEILEGLPFIVSAALKKKMQRKGATFCADTEVSQYVPSNYKLAKSK